MTYLRSLPFAAWGLTSITLAALLGAGYMIGGGQPAATTTVAVVSPRQLSTLRDPLPELLAAVHGHRYDTVAEVADALAAAGLDEAVTDAGLRLSAAATDPHADQDRVSDLAHDLIAAVNAATRTTLEAPR